MPCKCENKSYLDSYEVEADKLKKSNPSLSSHDVKMQVAQLFRPKFREWKVAAKVEEKGEADYTNGEFAFNQQGDMYYPKTGETAEGMHINQRTLSELPGHNANEYSLEDHQRTRLVASTLREGATQVVTAYGIRDIVEFNYDPKTNRGFIRILNNESEGSSNAKRDIKEIAKSKFTDLKEVQPKNEIFVLSDKPLTEHEAIESIKAVHFEGKQTVTGSLQYAGKQTIKEVGYTLGSIRRYIEQRTDYKNQNLSKDLLWPIGRPINKRLSPESKNRITSDVSKPRKESRSSGNRINRKKNIILPDRVITLVQEPRAGELVRKSVIAEVKKSITKNERKLNKKVTRREARIKNFGQKEMERGSVKKEPHKKITVKTERRAENKFKNRRLHTAEKNLLKKRKLGVEEGFTHPRRKMKKETLRPKRKEKPIKLFLLAKKLIRMNERMLMRIRTKEKFNQKPNVGEKRQTKEHVLNFSIAFVFWILLTKPQNILMPARRRGGNEYKNGKKKNKELISKKSSPWILLAIIWYLAMIRESGTRTVQDKTKKRKVKKKSYNPQFAPRGVIFAYAT